MTVERSRFQFRVMCVFSRYLFYLTQQRGRLGKHFFNAGDVTVFDSVFCCLFISSFDNFDWVALAVLPEIHSLAVFEILRL